MKSRLRKRHVPLINIGCSRLVNVQCTLTVLSRGGQDAKSVGRHFAYLSRKGNLEIETDDGRHIEGKGAEVDLFEDWDLDIQEHRPTSDLQARENRNSKLVHKILFSMPPGTPPTKVMEAVRVFAREEFGAKHRYAMVLHTDEPHPHVHMVVKAVSEDGVRLNIRKATLRHWRKEFARRLREQGIDANATERAVRGRITSPMPDGVFRAAQRGFSSRLERRAISGPPDPSGTRNEIDVGKEALTKTRSAVKQGWIAIGDILAHQGDFQIAQEVRRFAQKLRAQHTDQEAFKEVVRTRHATKRETQTRT